MNKLSLSFNSIAEQNRAAAQSFLYSDTMLSGLLNALTKRVESGALHAQNSESQELSEKSALHKNKKVVLFALRELHVPVLMPVYTELVSMGFAEVGFMAPRFQERRGEIAEEGLRESTIAQLREKGVSFWGHEKTEVYDCVVTADVCHDRVDAWGDAVCVGHGTISKNIYFIDNPFVRRESFATVLCVPGPWYVGAFGGQVKTRIVPTGFTKMDELAKDYTTFKFTFFKQIGFVNTRKTILFVPTFNDELTCMDMLLEYWQLLDMNKYQVLVKLHGATSEEWRTKYRELARQHSALFYVEDANIVPYMKICDMIVSDLSSAYLEGYVLDVPVLVGNNPRLKSCPFYNPKAVEFYARDAAYQFNSGAEFLSLVKQLELGDPMAQKRKEYRSKLFMEIDGKNSYRVAQIVQKVVNKEYTYTLEKEVKLSFYIPHDVQNMSVIEQNLLRLHKPAQIYSSNPSLGTIAGLPVTLLHEGEYPAESFMILTGSCMFATEIDKIWKLAQQWNPLGGIEGPLLKASAENLYQQQHLLTKQRVSATSPELHIYFKHLYFHYVFPVEMLFLDGMVVTERVPRSLLGQWLPYIKNVDDLYQFAQKVRDAALPVRVLGGLFGARDMAPI